MQRETEAMESPENVQVYGWVNPETIPIPAFPVRICSPSLMKLVELNWIDWNERILQILCKKS